MSNQAKIREILGEYGYQVGLEQMRTVVEYQNEAIGKINKVVMECLPKDKDDIYKRDFGLRYHNACQLAYNQAIKDFKKNWEERDEKSRED